MKGSKFLAALLILISVIGCAYDSEDDLIALEPDETQNPDEDVTESDLTYQADIRPFIESNCISCHSSPPRNGAPFALVNYDQVSGFSDAILRAISRQTGEAAAMPPAGRLPQNTIDQFEEWIENGMPED